MVKDWREGIWLGKRALEIFSIASNNVMKLGVLIDSYPLNKVNIAVCHEAVMINGTIYSLEGDKNSVIIIKTNETNYSWKYKGQCYRS